MPDLPADLADLERRLAARSRPSPPAGLRERVVAAARRETGGGAGPYVSGLAAAVLIGAALSLAVAPRLHGRAADGEEKSLNASAQRLRQLDPELSADEARGQALLLQA